MFGVMLDLLLKKQIVHEPTGIDMFLNTFLLDRIGIQPILIGL